ncbi:MAG: 2-oxoacid:acceptor oxidoreductase subunit alpha [Chloroflexi bacterium]|nr:2-oxoacid:acceptor oxidoreductase subunit alpha [Chloroflexota bacterium]
MRRAKAVVVRVSGRAGDGIITAGELLAVAAGHWGLHSHTFESYGAEVRGGDTVYQVCISPAPVTDPGERLDLLLAIDREAALPHLEALKEGGMAIYEGAAATDHPLACEFDHEGHYICPVPMAELLRLAGASARARNMVALGLAGRLLGLPQKYLTEAVKERFPDQMEANLTALKVGFTYAADSAHLKFHLRPRQGEMGAHLVMSGNEAVALGAIAAGLKLFAGYPITPATDIMEFLARELPKFGGAVLQGEDEMAALGMVLGASFAGERAMAATSGPGFTLMQELIGLASMAEIPAVIVDVQRGGPSTGLPTKPEQADLNLALYGSHGEAPRIVLAPTDVQSCFGLTLKAFNLADRYQMPVIILLDQFIAKRREAFDRPRLLQVHKTRRLLPSPDDLGGYKRYRFTESGVSPMARPGTPGGTYVATGLEHDEEGAPSYTSEMHRRMTEKRFHKLAMAGRELRQVHVFGSSQARVGLIGWGSTEGAVREAIAQAREQGLSARALYPLALNPLPEAQIRRFVRGLGAIIVPESNYTGQFASLLKARLGLPVTSLAIPEGRPITPGEVVAAIKEASQP